jgi:hypothetical protein
MSNPFYGITEQPYDTQLDVFEAILASKKRKDMAALAEESLFFMLLGVLNRYDAMRPWICDRCKEVQEQPDGRLDLWARFHYKSTIITFAQTLRDIAMDPELTFGIFSHTGQISDSFLLQLKQEQEINKKLHELWPDIFWREPRKEAPKWSQNEGIIVRRKSNPKECTVESWGLTDGQPTSRHFKIQVYDDVVTIESVGTPDQIAKTTACWEMSLALGTENPRRRYVGTRYHPSDTYDVILKRGAAIPRIRHATDNGQMDGQPVLLTNEALEDLKRNMGPRTFAAQMLLNPVSSDTATFKKEWLSTYTTHPPINEMNIAIICDPAGGKEKRGRKDGMGDYTVMIVLGWHSDNNIYLLPGSIRTRLNLVARADALFSLKRRYPEAKVFYEEYGIQADIEHVKDRMEREHYRFSITPVGGAMPKMQRIERLVPLFSASRIWLPIKMPFVDNEGQVQDFVQQFINDEYLTCPVLPHDDMLDDLARLFDTGIKHPAPTNTHHAPASAQAAGRATYDPMKRRQ